MTPIDSALSLSLTSSDFEMWNLMLPSVVPFTNQDGRLSPWGVGTTREWAASPLGEEEGGGEVE